MKFLIFMLVIDVFEFKLIFFFFFLNVQRFGGKLIQFNREFFDKVPKFE
jgi:hypothetical protein